jgi:hypothetical protein
MGKTRVLRLIQNGVATATLTVPEGVPGHVVAWAQAKVAADLAQAAPKSYLETAHALGRTTAQAVDARVRALRFEQPSRTYKECLALVLDADLELKEAYRDSAV